MSLYGRLRGVGPSGYGYSSTAEEVSAGLDHSGTTYLVTGCNSGLGRETVRVLLARGARVIAAARTKEKAAEAVRDHGGEALPLECELSEAGSIRAAIRTIREGGERLQAIIANAGIMALPERQLAHGVELQFFTNHVGHFMLITGLLDQLAANGRVVVLSSAAHQRTYSGGVRFDDLDASKEYSPWRAYGQSKLANLLFARELARRLPSGQSANAVHPGVIATNLGRHMSPILSASMSILGPLAFKSVAEGAATQTYVALHPDAAKANGEYFANSNVARSSAYGRDIALAQRLWERTEEIVTRL